VRAVHAQPEPDRAGGADDVETLYESVHQGDELTARTAAIIQAVLEQGAPKPAAPARPDLG
jgi:hypothetical protein